MCVCVCVCVCADVLKGDWTCHLKHADLGEVFLDGGRLRMGTDEHGDAIAHGSFSGLRVHDPDGKGGRREAQYVLQVQQDPSLVNAPRQAYKGSGAASSSTMWREGSRKEGCSCLYGNPCATADACQDWHSKPLPFELGTVPLLLAAFLSHLTFQLLGARRQVRSRQKERWQRVSLGCAVG